MKYQKYISLVFFLFSMCNLLAQPGKGPVGADDYLKMANELIFKSSYYNATDYLEKAMASRPDDPDIWYRLADTYRLSRNYNLACTYYEKVLAASDESIFLSFPRIRMEYGESLMQAARYKEAALQLQGFLDNFEGDRQAYYLSKADVLLNGCFFAKNPVDHTDSLQIQNLGKLVNSPYTNYAPREIGQDILMFSSLRSNTLIGERGASIKSGIFLTQRIDNTWTEPRAFKGPSRNEMEHVGHGAYSPDGLRFYFTKCIPQSNQQVECTLFLSEYNNGIWSSPISIRIANQKGFQSSTPHVVSMNDGSETIFFSSDRPGGYGGMDLWSMQRDQEGNFGNLQNLGSKVNTPYNELSPHYLPAEAVLYFSSDGFPGLGGYDIFKVYYNEEGWSLVLNMGKPYNSSLDDTYFYLAEENETGFLVSNRESDIGIAHSTCCDLIYEVSKLPPPPSGFTLPVSGTVEDVLGNAPQGVLVQLFQVIEGSPIWVDEVITKEDGSYSFLAVHPNKYLITMEKKEYNTQKETFETELLGPADKLVFQNILTNREWLLEVAVFEGDPGNKIRLPGFSVSIFDSNGNLLETKLVLSKNDFQMELEAGNVFDILIEKSGFQAATFQVSTTNSEDMGVVKKEIILQEN